MPATTHESLSSRLVTALDRAWAAICDRHPEVPEAVITFGRGVETKRARWGHFHADIWQRGDGRMPEVFVAGEGLKRGAKPTLATLLHEAAHGIANARKTQDTSRQGRYHNAKFRNIAREVGLNVEKDERLGWSVTTLPDETAVDYADELAELGDAITVWRHAEVRGRGAGRKSNNGVVARCECGRKIRVTSSVFEVGPIVCGVCGRPFEADEQDE